MSTTSIKTLTAPITLNTFNTSTTDVDFTPITTANSNSKKLFAGFSATKPEVEDYVAMKMTTKHKDLYLC